MLPIPYKIPNHLTMAEGYSTHAFVEPNSSGMMGSYLRQLFIFMLQLGYNQPISKARFNPFQTIATQTRVPCCPKSYEDIINNSKY